MNKHILTLNAGSATIKFAVFACGDKPDCLTSGLVEGITDRLRLTVDNQTIEVPQPERNAQADHRAALEMILVYLQANHRKNLDIVAVGHRIVHGGINFDKPALLDDETIKELTKLAPFAPLHQMHNLAGVAASQTAFPDALQYGCFDTAFHRASPHLNHVFALPRSFYDEGVRRYGFHGLSYEHIRQELGEKCAGKRVVIAHLGNGASLCALMDGQPVDTTMGFSPLDGLPMGTRCGRIDPGVLLYMMQQQKMTSDDIQHLLYHESGLKGLSGISGDMRALLASDQPAAKLAVDYFTHHTRREIAAMAASLSGLDMLIFTGGIGENAWQVSEDICKKLQWLGVDLDEETNRKGAERISSQNSKVEVLVIPANEELTIARAAKKFV